MENPENVSVIHEQAGSILYFVSIGINCMHQNRVNYHAEITNCVAYPPAGKEEETLLARNHYHHSLENNNQATSFCSGLPCQQLDR